MAATTRFAPLSALPNAVSLRKDAARTSVATRAGAVRFTPATTAGVAGMGVQRVALSLRAAPRGRRSRGVVRVSANADDAMFVDLCPGFSFFKVEAVIRPWRLSHVIKALSEGGIRGVTAYEVTGLGAQGGGVRERYAGHEFDESSLVAKTKLEVVVVAAQVNDVVNLIIAAAQTGEVGDGKLFVSPVSDVIRIRTAEHGAAAERMKGGREDMKRAASTDAN